MKNPITKHGINIFRLTSKDGQHNRLIITVYGSKGYCPVYAFDGYSDNVIGKAGGCGYDKTNTALERACSKIIGQETGADGGCGFQRVADAVAALGWTLEKVA